MHFAEVHSSHRRCATCAGGEQRCAKHSLFVVWILLQDRVPHCLWLGYRFADVLWNKV